MKIISPSSKTWLGEIESFFALDEAVAVPTETVYGLAAPIDRPRAVARIFELKNRPNFNPLIVHVKKEWDLSKWAKLSAAEKKIIDQFWPGPLSLLLEKTSAVSEICTASSPYVVLRAPSHPVFQKVLDHLQVPLAAPSANTSTYVSPTSLEHVRDDLGARGLIAAVDGGRCEHGIESTIVRVRGGTIEILREGSLAREELLRTGMEVVSAQNSETTIPGTQIKHYSPRVQLYLFSNPKEWWGFSPREKRVLYLQVLGRDAIAVTEIASISAKNERIVLSHENLREAAHKLFDVLREAEKKYDAIVALKTRDEGLGRAINDRLMRAAF